MLATDIMKQKKIANDDLHVYFGQLMGMSDSVTEALSDRGYNVVKVGGGNVIINTSHFQISVCWGGTLKAMHRVVIGYIKI